ncbi:hypothetical protein [Polynucleobacter sp. MWH-UH25E]|uniref:hypothetical protein n=1 Tax=Polynucleobacter sp. MWH-UH25E TaxID=1855616 RepID=UPI001BFD49D0|nr:hypothetical protein [Polynucleobacter sp. MWH-UH25E]
MAPVAFLLSYIFLGYCIEGDQIWYRKLYEALSDANLFSAIDISIAHTGGAEPLSAIILWVGAYLGIPKDVYLSIINTLLIIGLYIFLRKNRVAVPMIFLLLSNFYIVVLISFAERLKIAYLFLVLSELTGGKLRILLLFFSSLSHFQSIIILFCFSFLYFCKNIRKSLISLELKSPRLNLLIVITVIGLVFYIYDYLIIKINAYLGSGDPLEVLKLILLIGIPLYISSRPYQMAIAILPLLPIVIIIGGTRINMIAFTIAIYFLVKERKMNNLLVYFLMLYFSVKGLFFIEDVINTGQGFN